MKGDDEDAKKAALNTLYICLDYALKLLHPTMPYLTEELYQRLPHKTGTAADSICIAPFPETLVSFKADGVEETIKLLQEVNSRFRSQFAALNITAKSNAPVFIRCNDDKLKKEFTSQTPVVQSLIRSGETTVIGKDDKDPEGCLKVYVNENVQIYTKVVGLVDIKLEIDRIKKKNTALTTQKAALEKKMSLKGYESKVP